MAKKAKQIADRTFGVEIEVAGLSEEGAFLALRQAGIPVKDPNRYSGQPRDAWDIKDDGSIRSRDGRSAEVVSPILRGAKGLKQVAQVCKALSQFGAEANVSCGLHVHVGAQGLTAAEIETAVRRYAKWEKTIDKYVHPGRRDSRNTFCRSMAQVVQALDRVDTPVDEWKSEIARYKRTLRQRNVGLSAGGLSGCGCSACRADRARLAARITPAAVTRERARLQAKVQELEAKVAGWKPADRPTVTRDDLVEASGGRYRKLNLVALEDHGTLEFRHHNGSVDPKVVTNWIRFVVNFVERSRSLTVKGKARVRDLGPLTGLSRPAQVFFNKRATMRTRDIQVWASA